MSKQRKTDIPIRSIDSLRLEVEKAIRGSTDHQVGDTRARAQELSLNALAAGPTQEQLALAVKAVVLDPRSTDALVILADVFDNVNEYAEALHLIVTRAAEDLGEEFFQRERGHFWEQVESRPYMRARMHFGLALADADMSNQAIAEFEGILDLNATDNLGARYPLLVLYVRTGKLDMAASLLARFSKDTSTQFSWLKVLLAHLQGDATSAEVALVDARKANPHVEAYLTAKRHLPDKMPEAYSIGDPAEGIVCAYSIQEAWNAYPDTIQWLKEHEVPKQRKLKRGSGNASAR